MKLTVTYNPAFFVGFAWNLFLPVPLSVCDFPLRVARLVRLVKGAIFPAV